MYHFPFFFFAVAMNIQTPQGHVTQQGDNSSILEPVIVYMIYTCVYLDTLLEISPSKRDRKSVV